jgi:7-carboxy-7-deazaguanine synthase
MTKIPVVEIFGPTIQGEGMVIGQKTMFVRTAGCDYSCSWCDSAFTWDGSGKNLINQMEPEEIWEELKLLGGEGFSFVTISGGNPALFKNLSYLINIFKENHIKVALETQGSRWQDWFWEVDELTLSPKPPSSGMITDFNVLDMIIKKLNEEHNSGKTSLKIVIFNQEDFEYAKKIHHRYSDIPFFLQVGNRDINTSNNEKLIYELLREYEILTEKVINDNEFKDVKVLPQLHTLMWGNKRGV